MESILDELREYACKQTRLLAATAVLILCGMAGSLAVAQDAAPPLPKVMVKGADPDWEVASVKATDPAETRGQHINLDGRRVLMLGTTVEQFLMIGYALQKSQIVNLPAWAETTRWDVTGVPDTEGAPSLKQVQALMRKILEERFGLQLHHDQRELPVFALTVAKGGPKLIENKSNPDGSMNQNNSQSGGRRVENLTNTSMSDLVLILQFHVARPVIDQTGLKGRYDFKLQWTLDDAPASDAPEAPPGLFTALQDQVGLKLERVKAPADTLVIDHLEKPKAD